MKSDLFMFKLYFGWTQKRRQTEKLRWHIILLQQQKLRQPQKWKSEEKEYQPGPKIHDGV